MRWILVIIVAYLALAVQNILGIMISVRTESLGLLSPDILAIVAIFFALSARNMQDVLIVCWLLGLGLDLTSAGGPGGLSVVGPMALAYCAAGWLVFKFRDAFFRDRVSSQMIMAMIFVLLAHVMWVAMQSLVSLRTTHWEFFSTALIKACLVALYTGLLAWPVFAVLIRMERWLISPSASRGARER